MGYSKDNALTDAELVSLQNACDDNDPRERFVICASAVLGMRAGEVAHLNREWVDFQHGKIRIPGEMVCECAECKRVRGGIWHPKTKQGARTIFYKHFDVCGAAIAGYLGLYKELKLTRQAVRKMIIRVAQRTDIAKKVTPHTLRATAATNFAKAGFGAMELCAVMGWARLEVAQAYIMHGGAPVEKAFDKAKREGKFIL